MSMKGFPRKCAACGERAVVPVTLPSYATELEHDGRAYPVSIADAEATKCTHCGEVMLSDSADERLVDELRTAAGLLRPAEIREKRVSLGLTQKALSGYVAVAESTISR